MTRSDCRETQSGGESPAAREMARRGERSGKRSENRFENRSENCRQAMGRDPQDCLRQTQGAATAVPGAQK